jgi:polypeptide N-acetylgalactosaminyltransferase
MLSKTGEIRRDEACLDYAGSDVILYPCHGSKGNQYWEYEDAVSLDQGHEPGFLAGSEILDCAFGGL